VVDEAGRLAGIVSRADLLDQETSPDTPVIDVATTNVIAIGPEETLFSALSRMVEEGVDHLPVVRDGYVVGICTRTDVLQARIRQLDHEHVEEGWLSRLRA
jgi:CBS domain-containing protein